MPTILRARPPGRPVRLTLAAFAAPLLLAACAPMQPVADFGGAATHLAADYAPFTTDLPASCVLRRHTIALALPGPFDEDEALRQADASCAHVKAASESMGRLSQALSDYAGALVTLSKTKPTAFDDGIKGVSGDIDALKNRDGTAVVDAKPADLAAKALRTAAAVLLEARVQRLERSTLEHNQQALADVVTLMKQFVDADYKGELRETRDLLASEYGRLKTASTAAPADVESRLPWRWAQQGLHADIAANRLQLDRADRFDASADALLAAHAALIANFDQLSSGKPLASVDAFVAQVKVLERDVAGL